MSTLKNLHQQARRSSRPAFTLLELIVVLLVLGILAAIAVPTFSKVQQNSVNRAVQTTLEIMDRNGEAIGLSDSSLTPTQVAAAVVTETPILAGMTITRPGAAATIDVSYTTGSHSSLGTLTFAWSGDAIRGTISAAGANDTAELDLSYGAATLNFAVGTPVSYTATVPSDHTASTFAITSGSLPDGVTLNTSTGTISADGVAGVATDALDTSFNPGAGPDGAILAIAAQSNGKTISAGAFDTYDGTSRKAIVRLNADGTLDTSFNPGGAGVVGAYSWSGDIYAIAVQSDDKILIVGEFATYNGTSRSNVARLNADGTLDTSFNPGTGTGTTDTVRSVAVLSNGKILIGGDFATYNGTSRNLIARLNADGTLDTSFLGNGVNGTVYAIVEQSNGKILIGGGFDTYDGTSRNFIARLNADGTLDTSFNPGNGPSDRVLVIAVQPDGKILVGGRFTTYDGTSRNNITRLNANGSLDMSFDPGTGADNVNFMVGGTVHTIVVQSDGDILIGGAFASYNGTARNRIARLNAEGVLDPSFNPNAGPDQTVVSIVVQSDGKVIVAGTTGPDGMPIARFDASTPTGFPANVTITVTTDTNQTFARALTLTNS